MIKIRKTVIDALDKLGNQKAVPQHFEFSKYMPTSRMVQHANIPTPNSAIDFAFKGRAHNKTPTYLVLTTLVLSGINFDLLA